LPNSVVDACTVDAFNTLTARDVYRHLPYHAIGRHTSILNIPVVTTGVHLVSQPCCRSWSGSLSSSTELTAVLMLYRISNVLVAIPAADYLKLVPVCTRGFEMRYMQIQCNINTYSQSFLPHAISLWNSLAVDVCELSPDSFKAHPSTIQLI